VKSTQPLEEIRHRSKRISDLSDTQIQMTASKDLEAKAPQKGKWWVAFGLFLVVLALYILTSPGRIDIIDGQARYDVAYNWLVEGRPVIRDPWIGRVGMSVRGKENLPYSYYGAAASVFSMPLVWFGLHGDTFSHETSRFLFSLTSSIFGTLIAVILFWFYTELGLRVRSALAWAMVSTFSTLVWPASESTFDNAQHAFFAIAAAYLGFLAAKRDSIRLAIGGGLMAAVLIAYQEYFLLIIPALALCTIRSSASKNHSLATSSSTSIRPSVWQRPVTALENKLRALSDVVNQSLLRDGEERRSLSRYLAFSLTAMIVGLGLSFAYNNNRFGSNLHGAEAAKQRFWVIFGEPLSGFSTLVLSPGKSIFLYSPPLLLAFWGFRGLKRRNPQLAGTIATASAILLLFLSFISFPGGDWCWGPRYLVVLLPLWALTFPFVDLKPAIQRNIVVVIVGLGLVVQLLALSAENQRFFFDRGLEDAFYITDPWFYFKDSALFARVGEVISLKNGPPTRAYFFSSSPVHRWATYAIFGPNSHMSRKFAPEWMSQFKIYYLPRPWPLWMLSIQPQQRPIDMAPWLRTLMAMFLLGTACICQGVRTSIAGEREKVRTVNQEAEAL
jgi:hypothetical protein